MSVGTLLDRLQGVKQTAPGRWLAKCPAHEDRTASLSVRELDDGRILLHDFGACDTSSVLDAVGLSFADLFPKPLAGTGPAGGCAPSHSRIPARDLLELVSAEVTTAALIAADMLEKRTISEADWARLAQAAQRIGRARDQIDG